MTMYGDGRNEFLIGYAENQDLLGRSDMVINHLRVTAPKDWPYTCNMAALDFYTRALGTPDYGYVTVLREPVDRYISHFYYFTEPDARKEGLNITLQEHVAGGQGGNTMAAEFSLASLSDAMDFVASEQLADGLFIPVELLDYGLALLSGHCGWSTAHMLYVPANANTGLLERWDGLRLLPRPSVSELASTDPGLLSAMQQINTVDALLYSAAVAAFIARLSPGSAAAGTGVLQRAVRLTAARSQLQAACGGGSGDTGAAAGKKPARGSSKGEHEERDRRLAALCAWYTGQNTSMTEPEMITIAEEYGSMFDEPSLSFYHMLAGVRLGGAEAGAVAAAGTTTSTTTSAELQAAVSRWLEHHARAGFDHLVLCVDGLDERRVEVVRRAAHAVLAGGGGGKATGDAARARNRYVGTTYGVVRCRDVEAAGSTAKGPRKDLAAARTSPLLALTRGGKAGGGGASAFAWLVSRARWSVLLPDVRHYVRATRGTARSVLLSLEAALPDAGALCLAVVPWGEACRPGSTPGRTCTALPRAVRAADCVRLAAMPSLGYGRLYTSGGEELRPGAEAYGIEDERGIKGRPQHAPRALTKDVSHRAGDQEGGRDAAEGREDPAGSGAGASGSGGEAAVVLRQQHRLEVRQLPSRAEAEGAGVPVEECAARILMLARK